MKKAVFLASEVTAPVPMDATILDVAERDDSEMVGDLYDMATNQPS